MKLAIAFVVLGTTAASADDRTCSPAGGVLLTVQKKLVDPHDADEAPYTFVIYKNGAWTIAVPKAPTQSGCGSILGSGKHVASRISLALQAAPWKVTHAKPGTVACKEHSPFTKTYIVGGKPIFTEVTCGLDSLDAKSQASLEKIKEQVETITDERHVME